MALKIYKPTSPGRRNMTGIDYSKILSGDKPYKPLTTGIHRSVGRNNVGRITTRHKGGGHKRSYRLVDFKMKKMDIPARIDTIEYDPNRTSFICLATYADGFKSYVLAWKDVKVGDRFIVSETNTDSSAKGNRTILSQIPVGTLVFNVEIQPGGGAKMCRSAGSSVQVVAHNEGRSSLKMPSGEIRMVPSRCYATIGVVSNSENNLVNLGKAGRSRWKGIRPTVRGSAMNPVDHPHGGGEQKQGIGLRRGPKTAQGKLAYGVKTRKPKKYSNVFIVSRRKTKRNPN